MAERTVTRRRRTDDDYDTPDEGSSRSETSRGSEDAKSNTISRGRDGLRRHRETHQAGNFPTRFTVEADKKIIVKFLDADFFIGYYQHWLNDSPVKQKSFICLGEDEETRESLCPLCDIGDKPTFYVLINVLDFTNKRDPQVRVWYATTNPGECIEEKINDLEELAREKDLPADQWPTIADGDRYFVVSKKKGKNGFFSYSVEAVKARDLEEDYNIPPLDDAELAEFLGQTYNEDIVRITPRQTLREIANELSE